MLACVARDVVYSTVYPSRAAFHEKNLDGALIRGVSVSFLLYVDGHIKLVLLTYSKYGEVHMDLTSEGK